jgi:hypothetical protein
MAECPTCEKILDTEQGVKIHHATVHDEPLTENYHTCDVCGNEFYRPESQTTGDNTFCSKDCHGEWISQNESEKVPVICEWCCDKVLKTPSQRQDRQNHFCSHECHGEWKLDQGSVTVQCEVCGTDIVKNKAYAEQTETHFCSTDCQGHWYSENIRGENHPLWKEDVVSTYGPNWNSQRRCALQRDNHECQDCGLSREQHYEQYGTDLEVHHITPIRTFEDTEDANELENLVTLCTECHMSREHS